MRLLTTATALLLGSASALVLPYVDWAAAPDGSWASLNGACLMREETLVQPYPTLPDAVAAQKFAVRLQAALGSQKMQQVVTQVVERPGTYTVLANYLYAVGDATYKVTQLYLPGKADKTKLRTITGSALQAEGDSCVENMREFLRYKAE